MALLPPARLHGGQWLEWCRRWRQRFDFTRSRVAVRLHRRPAAHPSQAFHCCNSHSARTHITHGGHHTAHNTPLIPREPSAAHDPQQPVPQQQRLSSETRGLKDPRSVHKPTNPQLKCSHFPPIEPPLPATQPPSHPANAYDDNTRQRSQPQPQQQQQQQPPPKEGLLRVRRRCVGL